MTLQKLSKQQAREAAFTKLLWQTKWAKTVDGPVVRVKRMPTSDVLSLIAWMADQSTALYLASDDSPEDRPPNREEALRWLWQTPLWVRLAAEVVAALTGLPLASVKPLVRFGTTPLSRHLMAGDSSFFLGTQDDLACFTEALADHDCPVHGAVHEHPPGEQQ